jgi:hypothetical protein
MATPEQETKYGMMIVLVIAFCVGWMIGIERIYHGVLWVGGMIVSAAMLVAGLAIGAIVQYVVLMGVIASAAWITRQYLKNKANKEV